MNTYANAQYVRNPLSGQVTTIRVGINGVTSYVPIDESNADYQNMMKLVAQGKLVIAPAD